MKKIVLALIVLSLGLFGARTAPAQQAPHKFTAKEVKRMSETQAIIETKFGAITLKFFPDVAPNHVKNFIDLAKKGFYDGTIFHRVIPGFMIQGGDPITRDPNGRGIGTGGPGYTIKAEFNDRPHKRGTLSMARTPHPDSATSQFFINLVDNRSLDYRGPGPAAGYCVFAAITEGMDIVDEIAKVPTVRRPPHADVPKDDVVLISATVL